MTRKIVIGLVVCILITLDACGDRDAAPPPEDAKAEVDDRNSFVIHNARVFDGTDLLEGKSVVVADGMIEKIADDAGAWQSLRQVDGQ